mgnify:CR=1 FL=1
MIRRWLEEQWDQLRMLGQLLFLLAIFCILGSMLALPMSLIVFMATVEWFLNALVAQW